MTALRFGTDGWRALVAEEFTFPNVRVVTQGVASYLKKNPTAGRRPAVIVGYDTRPLGDRFAEAVAEVFAGNGFQVFLTRTPMPTPAISFAIRELHLQGGIAVTASHNPFTYNGLKFKPSYAGPAEPEMTRWIEGRLFKEAVRRIPLQEGLSRKRIVRVDLESRYLSFLRRYVEWPVIRRAKFRVAYESMGGAGQDLLQKVLAGSRIEVVPVPQDGPMDSHHRPEPIGEHLRELSKTVQRLHCDVGLATDGDADRLGLVGPDGLFVSAQETMALLLWHLLEDRGWRGRVVSTVSASNILDEITGRYGVEFRRTPVGFKHIARLIRDGGVLFGGEESGGFGFRGCVPERDGLLAGLLVLEMMAMRRRNLARILTDLRKQFGRWYFERTDLELKASVSMDRLLAWSRSASPRLERWFGRGVRVDTMDGVKIIAAEGSWLLLRPSGTEPLLRIYGEAKNRKGLETLLRKGREVGRAIVES